MLVHEFIAMAREDIPQEISYNLTKKYDCVAVHDDTILDSYNFWGNLKTEWDQVGNLHEGLNYHGITIMPTETVPEFIEKLQKIKGSPCIFDLLELCNKAKKKNECIVHFGI